LAKGQRKEDLVRNLREDSGVASSFVEMLGNRMGVEIFQTRLEPFYRGKYKQVLSTERAVPAATKRQKDYTGWDSCQR